MVVSLSVHFVKKKVCLQPRWRALGGGRCVGGVKGCMPKLVYIQEKGEGVVEVRCILGDIFFYELSW